MPLSNLTQRECDVLSRLALGMTSTQIAFELHLSRETVREYIARI